MENGNGCIHAKFSKHGKNSHTWSIYNIIYTHTSQFLGCSSKSKYSTWIRYTILQYTTRFSNQLCKIPMWLPFRINNISPKKSDSQFQNARPENRSYPGEAKIIYWLLPIFWSLKIRQVNFFSVIISLSIAYATLQQSEYFNKFGKCPRKFFKSRFQMIVNIVALFRF